MADVEVRTDRQIIAQYKRELSAAMRDLARPVLKAVRSAAPKGRTGTLRRKIKAKVKYDADGPYVRITTSARRTSTSVRTRTTTTYRYGLAEQGNLHYLQKGLDRTPRR